MVTDARPDIISHNMETVRRISPLVRSVATYDRSLEVIRQIAESGITTKSGIMVGLGETPEEVEQTRTTCWQTAAAFSPLDNISSRAGNIIPFTSMSHPNNLPATRKPEKRKDLPQ